jgi:hypothetical protein
LWKKDLELLQILLSERDMCQFSYVHPVIYSL